MTNASMTVEDVRTMLVEAVAVQAGITPEEVPADEPFTSFGLDSMAALAVGMEIEDNCGLSDLATDLLWDYPTINTLTDALWKLMNPQAELVAAEEQ
ncbi:acyl carrier protein [Kineosporia sp. J2-2]|uniref:Acyl carrier protein n=1 Tax=Kineosporia corallincola TaxID=2835133 RepID=A0ABS5TP09_9ACTN|nr:acyl carrier protein [Kineosporia corallincola]MBT0772835.1 acyl carrier protein [Kineosporia corallincola]